MCYYEYKLIILKAEKLFLQCLRCLAAGSGNFFFSRLKIPFSAGHFFYCLPSTGALNDGGFAGISWSCIRNVFHKRIKVIGGEK